MKTILKVKNLYKSYEEVQVLNNISFEVHEGEFLAIMGPSGSGKSTLLYNVSGMDRHTSGEVDLWDKDISNLSDEEMSEVRLKQMGFIFQHSYLLKNLSIKDNIVLPGFKAELLSRDQVKENADNLLEKTDISDIAGQDIKKVSGGQLQRAAICRALINTPDILFCDEPTGALNTTATKEVMDIINSVNGEGTTVIMVTHDLKVASRASRIIYLIDGSIKDELELGQYQEDKDTRLIREKKLSDWLENQGF